MRIVQKYIHIVYQHVADWNLNRMKVEFSPLSHKEEIIFTNLIPTATENLLKYYRRFVCVSELWWKIWLKV